MRRAPHNASKWQIGFNSAFKGLMCSKELVIGPGPKPIESSFPLFVLILILSLSFPSVFHVTSSLKVLRLCISHLPIEANKTLVRVVVFLHTREAATSNFLLELGHPTSDILWRSSDPLQIWISYVQISYTLYNHFRINQHLKTIN